MGLAGLKYQLVGTEGHKRASPGDWTQDRWFTKPALYHWAIEAWISAGNSFDKLFSKYYFRHLVVWYQSVIFIYMYMYLD